MSNGTKYVWILMLLVFMVLGGYYFYNTSLRVNSLKEVAVERGAFDAIVVSLEGHAFLHPSDLYQAPMQYLTITMKAMKARTFVGMTVFSRKSREDLYDEFMQHVIAFRAALITYSPVTTFGNDEKKEVMNKIITSCETVFAKGLVADAKDLKTDSIYLKWRDQDQQKLNISDSELPVSVAKENIPRKSENESRYSQLDVRNGKNVNGEEIGIASEPKEPVKETVRTKVDFANLKALIGERIEVQKMNGAIHDGKLAELDEVSLTLNISVVGGHFTIKILKDDIKKMEQITVKNSMVVQEEE